MQYKNEKTSQLLKIFGNILKKNRLELNKSQTLLSYEYDIDSGNLSRIENGKIDPKLTMLRRISEALNIPLSELIKQLEEEVGDNFHIMEL